MNQPDHLIKEMQQGNEKAFSSLYQMYSGAIQGVVYSILKDRELTEEVVQDIFIKVWNHSHTYKVGKGRFYTWLLNIARNTAIDRLRSKDFKNSNKNLATDNFVDIVLGHDNLSKKMDALGIREFVEALKPICIQIIDLLYFKGFTQAETAKELNSPLGTIKTRARSCIKELRNKVRDIGI